MSDEASEEATGREREVLRTRRESRDRLGDRAFALNLQQALGVPEPDTARASGTGSARSSRTWSTRLAGRWPAASS